MADSVSPERPSQLKTAETGKPEPLSNEELGNLLAAIGNHEAKAITLICMKKGTIYTRTVLREAFDEKQGGTSVWDLDGHNLLLYCHESFEEIGLVSKPVWDSVSETWGHMKTDYGEEQGNALAGLLLDFSLNHENISLYKIFGVTASVGSEKSINVSIGTTEFKNRSPIFRLRMIWELATREGEVSAADLDDALGSKSKSHAHIDELIDHKLVHSRNDGPTPAAYQLKSDAPLDRPSPVRKLSGITNLVYDLLSSDPNKAWSTDELAQAYIAKRKAENPKAILKYDPKPDITRVTKQLQDQGYLYKAVEGKHDNLVVWLDEDQRLLFVELLTIIDQFQLQDEDTLRRGRMLAEGLTPIQARILVQKAKENSPTANSVPVAISRELVLSLVRQNPQIPDAEVKKLMVEMQNRKLSMAVVQDMLNALEKEGRIESKKVGKIRHWNVTNKGKQLDTSNA